MIPTLCIRNQQLGLLLFLILGTFQTAAFIYTRPTRTIQTIANGSHYGLKINSARTKGFTATGSFTTSGLKASQDESSDEKDNADDDDDTYQTINDRFFFEISKDNIDAQSSMDSGIHELLTGGFQSDIRTANINNNNGNGETKTSTDSSAGATTVVVMDWECLLDALPYHIELGIHAARTVWPHLNDLCNFDTDQKWLENKLKAMSHVLPSPEGPDRSRHVACEFALATRLILEEQALDRNESTGKQGKYARRFHPRSEIKNSEGETTENETNNERQRRRPSRRPLTAGELAVNWREFIRSTLVVKYSQAPEGNNSKQPLRESKEPLMESLEHAIEDYLKEERFTNKAPLRLFPQTKFALRNSSSKLVVRISNNLDNVVVSKSLNQRLDLLPHERIAKTYKPENAIRRLFLNNKTGSKHENKNNMILLLRPEVSLNSLLSEDQRKFNSQSTIETQTDEETCLRDIMKFAHDRDNANTPISSSILTPTVLWIDSSWHRLQGLVSVFGDAMPRGNKDDRSFKNNLAKCSIPSSTYEGPVLAQDKEDSSSQPNNQVWLGLWLADWITQEGQEDRSSENQEAAMVYPWTDSLSWEMAEDMLIPSTWGSSETAFQ